MGIDAGSVRLGNFQQGHSKRLDRNSGDNKRHYAGQQMQCAALIGNAWRLLVMMLVSLALIRVHMGMLVGSVRCRRDDTRLSIDEARNYPRELRDQKKADQPRG